MTAGIKVSLFNSIPKLLLDFTLILAYLSALIFGLTGQFS